MRLLRRAPIPRRPGCRTGDARLAAYTIEFGRRKDWLLAEQLRLRHAALEAASRHLAELSRKDPLTGLDNRRSFDRHLASLWEDPGQHVRPLALLILDVDHFKAYNDANGHAGGDACLRRIATTLDHVARRESVFVARLGGEEFAVVASGVHLLQAFALGERFTAAIRSEHIHHHHSPTPDHVTLSIGVGCAVPAAGSSPSQLLVRADEALYRAKVGGRDRVIGLPDRDHGDGTGPSETP